MQKVTVHAGVLLSDATALLSPRSPDVVLGERVLRMLISCPECHRIPLTRLEFMFETIEDTPNIIRTGCIDNDPRKRGKYLNITCYFVQRFCMTFPVSLAFMTGSDSPPVDTDSPSHLVSPLISRSP